MAYGVSSLMTGFQRAEAQARAANIAREQELRGMYSKIVERYQPGGAFQKGALAEIETAKTRGVGQEMQQLISSGMYGTTTAAGAGSRWEAEVGTPARLRLEDISMERLTQAEQAKAGFIERIQEPYPDYGPLMQAVQATSAAPSVSARTLNPYMQPLGSGSVARFQPATGTTTSGRGAGYTAPTATRAAAPAPTAARPAVVKPTKAEEFTIQERLKKQYPQMYKPGWGKTTTTKKPSLWSRISSAALGRPF